MKFVKATTTNNEVWYIAIDKIAVIANQIEERGAGIMLDDKRWLAVSESPEVIIKNIEAQLKPTNKDLPS